METIAVKQNNSWVIDSDLPDGEYLITIRKERNLQFHKKFFALLNCIFENQDIYDTVEQLRIELLMRAGYFHIHSTLKGNIIYFPKSISFSSMDEIEFNSLYNKILDVVFKYFIKGSEKDQQVFIQTISSFL